MNSTISEFYLNSKKRKLPEKEIWSLRERRNLSGYFSFPSPTPCSFSSQKIDMCFLWAQCPAWRLGNLCSTHPSAQGLAAAAPPDACCQETIALDSANPQLFSEYQLLPGSVLGARAQSGEETSVFAF